MRITGLVAADVVKNRPARGDFPASSVRELLVMDRDEHPLSALLTVNIDPEDPGSPVSKGAPSLVNCVVELGVHELAQYEGNKKLVAKARIVKIVGTLELKPAPGPSAK